MVAFASMLRAVEGHARRARVRQRATTRASLLCVLRAGRLGPARRRDLAGGSSTARRALRRRPWDLEVAHKRLAQEKGVILAWAHSVSEGAAAELTVRPHTAVAATGARRRPSTCLAPPTDCRTGVSQADATNAAEWIRQLLTVKIEHGDKQLAMMQSKVVAAGPLQGPPVAGAEVSATLLEPPAVGACEHNGAMCMKLCGHGLMDVSRDLLMGEKRIRTSMRRLARRHRRLDQHGTLRERRNSGSSARSAGGRGHVEADATFKDVRDASVHDHLTGIVCGLSHNSAQEKLLMASGCVESMLKLMATHRGAVRVNAACVVSNLVGREDNSRMESDETIVEEVLDALKMTLEDRRVYGRRYATCSGRRVANLANNDENKKRPIQSRGHSGACANTDATRGGLGEGVVLGHHPLEPRVRRGNSREDQARHGDALAEAASVGS